jgi:hypothetical protein
MTPIKEVLMKQKFNVNMRCRYCDGMAKYLVTYDQAVGLKEHFICCEKCDAIIKKARQDKLF